MASTDSRPVPIKNTAYRVVFPILDADGDLVTGATGLDSEVSKDQGTFADCTNEATEIATSSGMYYLDLTSTEMNADCVAVIVKTSSSGAKTTPIVLYPQESGDIKVDVQSYGGTAGTFSGGRPEVNTSHIAGSAVSTSSAQIGVNVVNAGGTAWGSGAITAASLASGAITSAKFAAGAIDAAAIADNAIDLATFAADAKALMGVVAFGTLQAVTNTTAQLATGETFADDEIIGATILFRSATTGAGQSRVITDYVGATDTCTFDALTTTPTGTITYVIFATSPASTSAPIAANVTQWNGSAVATPNTAGVPKVDTVSVSGTAQTARDIGASVLLSSGTGTGQISLSSGTVTVGTNNDKTGYTASTVSDKTGYALTSAYDFAKGTTAMTESYATDGAAMTPAQALHQIWSLLSEKNIASTTLTAKKLDGSSTAMTFTLDSATTPTSITRAT